MSFAYMFKFIIIGDTGTPTNMKVSGNPASSCSSSIDDFAKSMK